MAKRYEYKVCLYDKDGNTILAKVVPFDAEEFKTTCTFSGAIAKHASVAQLFVHDIPMDKWIVGLRHPINFGEIKLEDNLEVYINHFLSLAIV